jgi:hypothetical protein
MYTIEGIPHSRHREPTNAAVESDNCVGCGENCCALDDYYIQVMNMQCLSFHMSNHCRHQACLPHEFCILIALINLTFPRDGSTLYIIIHAQNGTRAGLLGMPSVGGVELGLLFSRIGNLRRSAGHRYTF